MDCIHPRIATARMAAFAMLVVLMCLAPSTLRAGHVAGVGLTYQCINGCTIRVEFKAYRDCSSSITNIAPTNTTFSITADSGCALPTAITPWINASNIDVTPVCPGTPTGCNTPGAIISGYMEHYWYRDYDFCAANCSDYTIAWQTCCRSAAINTLWFPTGTGTYTSTTINPLLTPCNSTPVFTNPPALLICQGQTRIFDQGGVDPDGDSLVYTLGPCQASATTPVSYLLTTNPTTPLGNGWNVVLDTASGDLHIAPNPGSPQSGGLVSGVLCIYVQEWRNGQLINTVVRDVQLTVVPCPPNDPPTTLGIMSLSGGLQTGPFSVKTCLGATVCFEFKATDSDLGQLQTVYWNQALAAMGATFTLSSNPAVMDTITGQLPIVRFCWTPTVAGLHSFGVTMHDDACPIFGISQYNFQILVTEMTVASQDSVTGCKEVGLCALPQGGTGPYTYAWSGAGGLTINPNNSDSCLNHSYPAAGSYPFTLLLEDAIGCTALLNDTVIIPNNVAADAGPDTFACANTPVIIGNPPQPSPLLLYNWSPITGLTNPFSAQPTVTLPNNSLVPIHRTYVLTILDTISRCLDADSMTLTIYPIPSSPFNLQDSACQNQSVGMLYVGQNGPSATYNWTAVGATPQSFYGPGPHQLQWAGPGLHEVTLTVEENGCSSPTQRDSIFVKPIPVASILPVNDQCLVGNFFNFSNYGTYGNTATHQWTFWPNASPGSSNLVNPTGVVFGAPGPKLVTLTTTEYGCQSAPDSITFTVHPDPNALWGTLGGVQCFDGNSYQFVANAGNGSTAAYTWTFQDGTPAFSTDTLPVVSFGSPGPKVVTLQVNAFGCTSSHTDTIWVFPEPSVVAGPDTSFCAGDGGVTLLATATGGTAPYYYSWSCMGNCGIDSINDNDPNVNPAASGFFVVQVSDANGCTAIADSVYVTVLAKPVVNAGPDMSLCGLGAPCQILMPSVTGVGPFVYEWFPAIGLNDSSLFNPCARPDTTTIYTLVATDLGTGCTSARTTVDTLSTVTVHVHPVPVAVAGPDLHICDGDTAQLTGMGLGAGPAYQYQWTPGSALSNAGTANPLASPAFSTDYSLVVFSNGCPSIADTVTVFVHTMPSVDAGWNREICLGDSIHLDASAAGDSTANYTFQWLNAVGLNDPNLEDPLAAPTATMTYFVIATSNWGCASATDSVTVNLLPTPLADAGRDTLICHGGSLVLQGSYSHGPNAPVPNPSQIVYSWTPTTGSMNDSTLAQPTVHPVSATMYHLTVQHATCATSDSVLVMVMPELQATATADSGVVCAGQPAQLHAAGGLGNPSFSWFPTTGLDDPHAQHPTVTLTSPTTFTLILSEAGCHDTVQYTLDVLPSPEASFLHSLPHGCAPLDLSLLQNSSTAIAYVWDFGDGSPVSNAPAVAHQYAQPGDYAVHFTAVHTGGCLSEGTPLQVHVSAPVAPIVEATPVAPAMLYLPAATLQLAEQSGGIASCTWDFGDGFQAEGLAAHHEFTAPGIYTVTLHTRDNEGCMHTTTLGPWEVLPPSLFIPNVFSPNGDGINDRWLVEYEGDQPFRVDVRDRWGAPVFTSRSKAQAWDGLVGGTAAPDGVYYYRVAVGDKEWAGEVSLLR